MDRPASPGSRVDGRSRRRSWRTGRRCSTSAWWSHASRSWRYEEGPSAGHRARAIGRQGGHGQRGAHRARARVLSDPGEARDGGARRTALQGHDLGSGRALRAAQPARPEFPAARRARRRWHDLAQDRRPGQGVLDRAVAPRAGDFQVSDRVLAVLEGGILTATLNRPEKKNAIDTPMVDALLS